MFAFLTEPYAMIQMSILHSVINQVGSNVAYIFYFYISAEPLGTGANLPLG